MFICADGVQVDTIDCVVLAGDVYAGDRVREDNILDCWFCAAACCVVGEPQLSFVVAIEGAAD